MVIIHQYCTIIVLGCSHVGRTSNFTEPTSKHMLTGFIMYDVKGKGARDKIAKHQQDMIDGIMGSYSHLLNDSKHLKSLNNNNELTAMIANVSADADKEMEKWQVVAKQRAADKEAKKLLDETKEAAKKKTLMPKLAAIMEIVTSNDANEIASQTLATLRDIIQYYFESNPQGLRTMKKHELLAFIANKLHTDEDMQYV
jgi:hypothetical protein